VQRPKLLYSRTRQSDLKTYGDDRGFLIDETGGNPSSKACYGLVLELSFSISQKQMRKAAYIG
ncbi:hypothetical protein Tco_0641877, partial [Tanacetum coccineum]